MLQSTISLSRGFQCVHCVMHNCIMVKVGGKENHRKHVQNTEILRNQREIRQRRGMKDFAETGGQWSDRTKIEGNILNLWSMTKKNFDGVREIFRNWGEI